MLWRVWGVKIRRRKREPGSYKEGTDVSIYAFV